MKILYTSDVHGDFRALEIFAEKARQENPDMMIVAGDYINGVYGSKEDLAKYNKSWQVLSKFREDNGANSPLVDLAQTILQDDDAPDEYKQIGKDYIEMLMKGAQGMGMQYNGMKQILDNTGLEYMVLPGNYDSAEGLEQIFKEKNIHNKSKKKGNVKMYGVGGASISKTQIIPEELITPYLEAFNYKGGKTSKLYDILMQEDADIVVLHQPPYGATDITQHALVEGVDNKGQHTGSIGATEYILEKSPKLVLAGHVHEALGIEKINDTYVVNPGNLGRGVNGNVAGTFYELDVDDETGELEGAALYQITDYEKGEVSKVAEYRMEDGELKAYNVAGGMERTAPESLESRLREKQEESSVEIPKGKKGAIPAYIIGALGCIEERLKEYSGSVGAYAKKQEKAKERTQVGKIANGWYNNLCGLSNKEAKEIDNNIAMNRMETKRYNTIKELQYLHKELAQSKDAEKYVELRSDLLGIMDNLMKREAPQNGAYAEKKAQAISEARKAYD